MIQQAEFCEGFPVEHYILNVNGTLYIIMDVEPSLPAQDTLSINTMSSGVIQENVMLIFRLIISNNFITVETKQFEFCKFSHILVIMIIVVYILK